MYEIYCKLRDEKNCKDSDVAKATGITKSTFSDWKVGRSAPKNDKLQKIADYFGVPIDYLMTGKESPESKEPALTSKDERDIARKLMDTLDQLDSRDGLMFDGEVLDDETRELLRASLENSLRIGKITAKKKYTPKRYRTSED
ncbi:MAG: helix-turn-helix transcriptional regulator [Lachnospiraceae bacterium]|nr:helix-turn-helix transcriptional regulator [Lachnospiraceae bacterium]